MKKNFRMQEKKILLDVLSDKLIMNEDLMDSYFKGLFLMKNKEQLSEYMDNFVNKAAYLGYTNFSMKKLISGFRLLNPEPSTIDPDLVLNLLLLLSASDFHYKDLDSKTQKYVQDLLDIIEERFSGKRVAHIPVSCK